MAYKPGMSVPTRQFPDETEKLFMTSHVRHHSHSKHGGRTEKYFLKCSIKFSSPKWGLQKRKNKQHN